MPAKNVLKLYEKNGYYHLYNRGVAKNPIFFEEQDYAVFLSYLKEYLSPPVPLTEEELRLMKYTYLRKNYHQEIELLVYCLMPNHFHFLLKQNEVRSIELFMRSLLTRYSVYFNKHYDRVGHLFQGAYKGVLIRHEEYLLWLSRYIHRNPLELLRKEEKLSAYPYSSYRVYLGLQNVEWVSPQDVLTAFPRGDYRSFAEDVDDNQAPEGLSDVVLEY